MQAKKREERVKTDSINTWWRIIVVINLIGILLLNPTGAAASEKENVNAQSGLEYYVDSVNGSDSNSGRSPDEPWRSLNKVHAQNFAPGSTIYFKRKSVFTGGLTIRNSGTSSNPITYTSYGTGRLPIFKNPGSMSNLTSAITIRADWIVLKKLMTTRAQLAGVYIYPGSDHNIVRQMRIIRAGIGVKVNGMYNRILRNKIKNLVMVRNTPGGNDDYGAVGVWLYNSRNRVAFNTITNCKAQSYDYGEDGGTVEFWASSGASVNGNLIYNNYAEGNKGFSEFGGRGGSIRNNKIYYNVIVDNDRPLGFHLGGGFASNIKNLVFENNTIVDRRDDGNAYSWTAWTALIFNGGSPNSDTLIVRNNIFYLADYQKVANASGFTHTNNLYYFNGKNSSLGFNLGAGESISNPSFVNVSAGNFHLSTSSPAINAGYLHNYKYDYEKTSVPVGPMPDIGAYEYH